MKVQISIELEEGEPLARAVRSIMGTVPVDLCEPAEEPEEAPKEEPAEEAVPEEVPEAAPQEEAAPEPQRYEIKKGDTLLEISRARYGTDDMVRRICELNGLDDGDIIYVGEIILLP